MRIRFAATLLLVLLSSAGCAPADAPAGELTILHLNDLHARLLPDDAGRGGVAQLASVIESECRSAAACLVLDAGDLVQGSPVSTLFRGRPIYEVMNGVGLDVTTLGNHEFDYGWQRIAAFRETAEFPIINANVADDRGRLLADVPYVVLERGELKIGVIGVLTASLPSLVTPDKYDGWRLTAPAASVRDHLPEVAAQSDLVVVLGHLTDEEEQAIAAIEGIAAVVSGHGHRGLSVPRGSDDCPVVRVQAYGRELGRLDLMRKAGAREWSWQWKTIAINARKIAAQPEVARSVNHWEKKVEGAVDIPIGRSLRRLDPGEVRALLERALRETTGTDLAYVNRGGVRDTLPAGKLSARHIWNVMPFDNHVVVGTFKGRELPRSIFEERQLERDRNYRVATMDFVATMWNRNRRKPLRFEDTGWLVRDVAIDWIRDNTPIN